MDAKLKKLVIVEDDQYILKALQIKLAQMGIEIFTASDGAEGLTLIQKEKPNLVLLDLILPKMHGFEVLRALKKNNDTKDIPVIILSNLGQDTEKEEGLQLGALDYFIKADTSLEEIYKKINVFLS